MAFFKNIVNKQIRVLSCVKKDGFSNRHKEFTYGEFYPDRDEMLRIM